MPEIDWKVLKHRLFKEGNETVTICNRLKLPAADGKMRFTDVADVFFYFIQTSALSPDSGRLCGRIARRQ